MPKPTRQLAGFCIFRYRAIAASEERKKMLAFIFRPSEDAVSVSLKLVQYQYELGGTEKVTVHTGHNTVFYVADRYPGVNVAVRAGNLLRWHSQSGRDGCRQGRHLQTARSAPAQPTFRIMDAGVPCA